MKHHVHNISALSLLILLSVAGSSCSSDKQAEAATHKEAPPVEVVALHKERMESALQLPGELQAWQQVDLYAKEASFVKKLYVDVGSEVRTGQLLAQMDAPEVNSRVSGSESRLKSVEAIYTASKSNYERLYETSKTPGTVSQNDLDQAAARKNSDYAQYQAAQASYREAGASRDYLAIRAPFSGVVSARNVNAGAYVGPSGAGSQLPLFTVQEQQRLRLIVSVPEAYTSYLSNGTEVSFSVKARPDEVFKAKATRLAGALDQRLRAERVEMDVNNADKKLLPGMVAEVALHVAPAESTFFVPKTAIVSTTERVFVIRANKGKAEWVDIKKGRESKGRVEVFGALAEGDQIVKTANDEIREGSAIIR